MHCLKHCCPLWYLIEVAWRIVPLRASVVTPAGTLLRFYRTSLCLSSNPDFPACAL